MDSSADQVKTGKKGIFGWMMFDWAAQPFFTVVTTFIFGPYVVSRMVEDPDFGQAAWSYGIAFAGIFIAILSPILGSIADHTGSKKRWIGLFAILKIICVASLWFAEPGSNIFWVLLLFSLATIAAEFSTVFNDSMMTHLIDKKDMGRISNIAWGLGYLGGMIVLIAVVGLLAASPDTGKTAFGLSPLFGLDPVEAEGDRIVGPLSAFWYLIFILPMFLFTPDIQNKLLIGKAVKKGVGELKETIGELKERAGLLRFFIARMIYQDGVVALIALGGTFAVGLFAWPTIEIGIFGIILNVFAIFGCLVASWLDQRMGSKWVVVISILLLLFATIGISSTGPGYTLFGLIDFSTEDAGGLYGTAAEKAYLFFGIFVGLAFGPVQASSRSYLAQSVSREEAGKYFGIYALSGRATSFLAPFMVGTVTLLTGSARYGMATLCIFFIVGLFLLLRTPYPASNKIEH